MRKNIPIPYKSVWKHIWHGGGQGDPMADGASGSQGGHGLRLADLCESGGPKQPHSETMISLELDPGVWTCIAASSHGKPARRTGRGVCRFLVFDARTSRPAEFQGLFLTK